MAEDDSNDCVRGHATVDTEGIL